MQRNRTGTFSIIIAAILVIAAFLLVSSLNTPEQGLYDPARVALINARRQLSESFSQEQEILEQVRRVHKELDASLALLASAEQSDPTIKAPIDALRAQIA